MFARLTLSLLAAALVVSMGVAWAATGTAQAPTEAASVTTVVETSTSAALPAEGQPVTIDVADAGTVAYTFRNGVLAVTEVVPNPGWDAEIEVAEGVEIEVSFSNGLDRVDFNAELEDGRVRVRVRVRPGDGGVSTTLPGDRTSTTLPEASSTTLPDDPRLGDGSDIGTFTVDAGAAGTVTYSFDGQTLTVDATSANDGWSVEVEAAAGGEIEVEFQSADTRVDFEAEIDDGGVTVEVEVRPLDDDDDHDDGVTSTTLGDTDDDDTSTTIADGDDDHDDDEDDDEDDDDDDDDEDEDEDDD